MGNERHHKSAGSLPVFSKVGNVPFVVRLAYHAMNFSESIGSRIRGGE